MTTSSSLRGSIVLRRGAEPSSRPLEARAGRPRRAASIAIGATAGDDHLRHDLNNLMAVVLSATEALAEAGQGDPGRAAIAATSLEAARCAAELVRQVIGQRREAGLVSCDQVLATMAVLARQLLPPGVRLEQRPTAEPMQLSADRAELQSALLNLCKNAAEACAPGGRISLSATRVSGREAGGSRGRTYVRFEVADDGTGMSPEHLALATQPYFTTKRERGGAGLGLASVARFAEAAGGALRIDSTPGEGTVVSLFVPETRAASPAKAGI